MNMKLQILVPQYNESDEVIKPLLDSIAIQQSVDLKNDVGVIIVNDGSDVRLSDEILENYPFRIDYYVHEHKGVSATRNACLDYATADYVMFCDADDMFYNACGLYIIFREMVGDGFDSLISAFIEETRHPKTGDIVYITHDMDTTFVHGKVHRRQFLIDNNIRWNDDLLVHEDSYFNCLCQRLSSELRYSQTAFYLWKWRDASVCRHDPKYILKTYSDMIDSNDALINQFLSRDMVKDAQYYTVSMIYEAFFNMNKDEWLNQDNHEYRESVERRFYQYWVDHKELHDNTEAKDRAQIIKNIRTRMFDEGMVLESLTFSEWINSITKLYSPNGDNE